jgi:tetratricopeptide (TPR) repeat protein
VFDRIGRYEQAIDCFYDALKLQTGEPSLLHSVGHAFYSLARIEEAAEWFRRAIALMPDFPEAQMGLAECLLISGQLEAGWRLYEYRWKTRIVTGGGGGALARFARDLPMPQWYGEEIAGKTILLHAEQGYGDALQFCRYAAEVARRGARVALEVPAPLVRLMSSLDGIAEVYERGAAFPQTDYHCPLMSLPLALGMTAEKLPGAVPYIRALPELVESWAATLADDRRPRIGLVWYGQRGPVKEIHRSLPPELLAPFGKLDATFVSLQLELRPQDREVAFFNDRVRQFQVKDFADSAGLVANLDLVITVDTAMAHLAGALGKPVWILLPTIPDWRWGLSGAASDWYPSARLFRQRRQGDWDPVIADVMDAIRHLPR